jgi:hypothetical protein
VHPRFRPLAGDGANPVELSSVTMASNEVVQLDLSSLVTAAQNRQDMDAISVEIINDGQAGSLVGALNGIDHSNNLTYDVPLRDSGILRNSTGAYPFRLDGDFTTLVSITNVGDKPSEFVMQMNYEGGPYLFKTRKLDVGETALYDLKKIRDEQQPDWKGKKLPLTLTSGQIRWSIHGKGTDYMLGRSQVISASKKISTSYSCSCDCRTSIVSVDVNPGSGTVGVTQTFVFSGEETDSDCFGNQLGPYGASGTWSQTNENVASMQTDGTTAHMTALAEGQTGVRIAVMYQRYTWDGLECLYDGEGEMDGDGGMTVLPTITVGNVIVNPSTIDPINNKTELSITLSASSNASVSSTDGVTLQVGINSASQDFTLDFNPKQVTVVLSPGQSVTYKFTVTLTQPPKTTRQQVTLQAIVTAPMQSFAVVGNNKDSNQLIINPQSP